MAPHLDSLQGSEFLEGPGNIYYSNQSRRWQSVDSELVDVSDASILQRPLPESLSTRTVVPGMPIINIGQVANAADMKDNAS